MGDSDQIVKDMITIMIIYGIVIQVICLFVPGDHIRMSTGLWIGIITASGMAVHLRNSLDEALDLGAEGAQKYMTRSYAKRYAAVILIFILSGYFHLANVVTLVIGVMGLKASAYLQPVYYKLREKLRKSK